MLHPGRRFWFRNKVDEGQAYFAGPFVVRKFKQFLPAGEVIPSPDGIVKRKRSLIQIWTDPGGLRTLAVSDVRLNDPRRARK